MELPPNDRGEVEMSDLTNILPTKPLTVAAIESYWKQRGDSEPSRGYLGGSEIGHHCERYLWYKFRDCASEDFEGRLYRLVNRGHREEAVFVEELRGIGCEVMEVNPDTGEQFAVESCGGHFRGHADGVALGIPEAPKTWHLLEFKTSSSKRFAQLQKDGVEKAQPKHYAQMQVYMQLLLLDRALYLAVNKDTDELYSERIERIPAKAKALLDKAERIINATTPPERCADRQDSFLCKFCPAHALCWGQGESLVPVPALSCRQCCHASPIEGGWSCAIGREYGTPCERHLILPGLVAGYEPAEALKNADGSDVIEFRDEAGTVFQHGPDGNAGQFSSHDLMTLPKGFLSLPWPQPIKSKVHKVIQDARGLNVCAYCGARGDNISQQCSGNIFTTEIDLLDRYSGDTCHRVWFGAANELAAAWQGKYGSPMPEPRATAAGDGWQAAEFPPGICAFVWADGSGEIREDEVPF